MDQRDHRHRLRPRHHPEPGRPRRHTDHPWRPALRALTGIIRLIAIGGAAARDGRRLLRRRAVTFVLALAGITWLTAAAAFTLAEDVGIDGRVESFTDALWWAAATLTTVGYGDVVPVTFGGRVAGVVAMLVGISTFAVITARVAAFLVTPDEEPDAASDDTTASQPTAITANGA